MNKISVLLTFKNEREEVARTCKSIRDTAGDRVDIVVLNDDSDRDFDYRASLAPYNVKYYKSTTRLGSSLGKQFVVDKCETPYFLILDAHCRIYTENWVDILEKELDKGEDTLYCCKVQYFSNEEDHKSPKHMTAYGGYWDYNIKSIFSCGWNLYNFGGEEAFDIPCILGANYACSKRWWDYIGGYKGLQLYGREETFISKKSLMCGGKVKCLPTIHTGHKTREGNRQPYTCCTYEIMHNEMVIAYLLMSEKFELLNKCWDSLYNPLCMRDARNLFNEHIDELNAIRQELEEKIKITHEEVDSFNAEFQEKIKFDYNQQRKVIKGTYTPFGKPWSLDKTFPIG